MTKDIYGGLRRLDNLGRVVIPKDIRIFMGWKSKDAFNVFVDKENDRVYISKSEYEAVKK